MLALVSLVCAVVPMVLYLWIIWLMDRYDREPVGLLIVNFLWGALGAITLALALSIATSAALGTGAFADAVFVAPMVEEPAKAVFLLWTVRDRRFDNITDGLVYGMAIGLGFGMTENFLYFLNAGTAGEWVTIVLVRTLFSAVMHAMATGIAGASVGWTKFQPFLVRWPLRLVALALAVGMHSFWNFSVSVDNALAAGMGILFIILSSAVIVIIMQLSLAVERRLIARQLSEEAAAGVLPAAHVPILSSASRRRLGGWLPEHVDRRQYIEATTRLAFRKEQMRSLRGRAAEPYIQEVDLLRARIGRLLQATEAGHPAPADAAGAG